MTRFTFILTLAALVAISACSQDEAKITKPKTQLNLSILLDLSDRIEPSKNMMQIQKDSILLQNIVGIFKDFIKTKGTFASNDRINFYFHPLPKETDIITISNKMNIDLGKLDVRAKKNIFLNIEEIYSENISLLYKKVIEKGNYIGSDIYRFMMDGAYDKCIINKPGYVNILIIITDGYLYYLNTLQKNQNRNTYLSPSSKLLSKFRKDPEWKTVFTEKDYGFIAPPVNLSNLNILLLELNPVQKYPQDFDIMKMYWNKWFTEMKVPENNIKIMKTDLPNITESIVEKYFDQIISKEN